MNKKIYFRKLKNKNFIMLYNYIAFQLAICYYKNNIILSMKNFL